MTQTPPGWYDDPQNPSYIRWWDGSQWGATAPKNQTPPPPTGATYSAPYNNNQQSRMTFIAPSNYLAWSIINLFICLPFGIAGLIFSLQVNSAVQMGDQATANDSSSKARTMGIIGTVGAVIGFVLWIILIAAAASNGPQINTNGQF